MSRLEKEGNAEFVQKTLKEQAQISGNEVHPQLARTFQTSPFAQYFCMVSFEKFASCAGLTSNLQRASGSKSSTCKTVILHVRDLNITASL